MHVKQVITEPVTIDIPNDGTGIVAICKSQKQIDEMKQRGIAVIGLEEENASEGNISGGANDNHEWLSADYVIQSMDAIDEAFLEEVYCRFHHLPLAVTETKRTIIREFSMDDLDDLIWLYDQPHMTDYMDGLHPKEEEKGIQEAYIKNVYGLYGFGMWVIIDKETGKLMGRAGVEQSPFCGEEEVELGYCIAPTFQRKGYGKEVCEAILSLCEERFELTKFIAKVRKENVPSIRLLKSLGFHEKDASSDPLIYCK